VLDKAHVAVQLHGILFSIPHLLNFIARPACTACLFKRHIQNSELLIVCILGKVIVKRIFKTLLIADSKDEVFRMLGFAQCMLDRFDQLRVSLCRNLNEDGHFYS
jgi:hypothetical protein